MSSGPVDEDRQRRQALAATTAVALGREPCLEKVLERLLGETRPAVADDDLRLTVIGPSGPHGQHSAIVHGIACVEREVEHDPLDPQLGDGDVGTLGSGARLSSIEGGNNASSRRRMAPTLRSRLTAISVFDVSEPSSWSIRSKIAAVTTTQWATSSRTGSSDGRPRRASSACPRTAVRRLRMSWVIERMRLGRAPCHEHTEDSGDDAGILNAWHRPRRVSGTLERTLGRKQTRRSAASSWGGRHLLPDFIIIGAARSGTTHLLGQLNAHPNVLEGPAETHFFDTHRYAYGMGWYRLRFPGNRARRAAYGEGLHPVLTGESSPSYLAGPNVPARVARGRAQRQAAGAAARSGRSEPPPTGPGACASVARHVPSVTRSKRRSASPATRPASACQQTSASVTRSSSGAASTNPSWSAGEPTSPMIS